MEYFTILTVDVTSVILMFEILFSSWVNSLQARMRAISRPEIEKVSTVHENIL
jgi:hypothetical protein